MSDPTYVTSCVFAVSDAQRNPRHVYDPDENIDWKKPPQYFQ
jgi:hypothetical protein